MAKDYKRGDDYRLYLDTADTWATPTWVEIKACGNIEVDDGIAEIAVPERSASTGYMHGSKDPGITFELFEDDSDTNVGTLITALQDGSQVHLAVCNGDESVAGNRLVHAECVLFGGQAANRGEVAQWAVTARRNAQSSNEWTWETTT
jgi:hypothetical protein